jgi:hypothetical protein
LNSLRRQFENILANTDMDLSLSAVDRSAPSRFTVRSKASPVRVFLGLLFGIPCLVLLWSAWDSGGFITWAALVFCPPLSILAVLFGLTWQQRTFEPAKKQAAKSYGVFGLKRSAAVGLPRNGTLLKYRTFSAFDSGGTYFYHVEVDGVTGLGFSIAAQEEVRDAFADDLAGFLHYGIRDEGDRFEKR